MIKRALRAASLALLLWFVLHGSPQAMAQTLADTARSGRDSSRWGAEISSALLDSLVSDTTVYAIEEVDRVPIPVQIPHHRATSKQLEVPDRVVLRVLINALGKVRKVEIVEGVNSPLDSIAVATMSRGVFKPALKANRPVSTWIVFPIFFPADRPRAIRVGLHERKYSEWIKSETVGEVVIWAFIGRNGEIGDLLVESSTHRALTEAAFAVIRSWKYEPPLDDTTEKPTSTWTRIPLSFGPTP